MDIVVAFYKGYSKNPIDKFKQWVTKSWTFGSYSHCEIIINGMWYGALAGGDGRVAKRVIEPIKADWDYITIQMNNVDVAWLESFLVSKIGLKYDWKGLFLGQVFRFSCHNKDEYFCSEYVAESLNQIYPDKFSNKFYIYSPNSLYRLLKRGL